MSATPYSKGKQIFEQTEGGDSDRGHLDQLLQLDGYRADPLTDDEDSAVRSWVSSYLEHDPLAQQFRAIDNAIYDLVKVQAILPETQPGVVGYISTMQFGKAIIELRNARAATARTILRLLHKHGQV